MNIVRIVDLEPDSALWQQAFPVLTQLRPDLDRDQFDAIYVEGWPQGYRFTAAMDDEDRCLGVAGWRIVAAAGVTRRLFVEDLVSSSEVRGNGIGALLMRDLEHRSRVAGCTVLELDCAVYRYDAHRFYLRERLYIQAHHFRKEL